MPRKGRPTKKEAAERRFVRLFDPVTTRDGIGVVSKVLLHNRIEVQFGSEGPFREYSEFDVALARTDPSTDEPAMRWWRAYGRK